MAADDRQPVRPPAYAPLLFLTALAMALTAGCRRGRPPQLTPVEHGRLLYGEYCASCHNLDPNLPGELGPAIAGSPRALIAARVLHAAYPPGYRPQRTTHLMRPLPWLAPDLDDLTAYLAAAKRPAPLHRRD